MVSQILVKINLIVFGFFKSGIAVGMGQDMKNFVIKRKTLPRGRRIAIQIDNPTIIHPPDSPMVSFEGDVAYIDRDIVGTGGDEVIGDGEITVPPFFTIFLRQFPDE